MRLGLLLAVMLDVVSFGFQDKKETTVKGKDVKTAIDKGVEFLLDNQNKDGSWGSAKNTKDLNYSMALPGSFRNYKTACTAIACIGLFEYEKHDPSNDKVKSAVDKAIDYLLEHGRSKRSGPGHTDNSWAYAYTLRALLIAYDTDRFKLKRDEIRKKIEEVIGAAYKYQSGLGGWGYYEFQYYSGQADGETTTFTTASVLVSLHEAKKKGFKVDSSVIEKGTKYVKRLRVPDGSYIYGYYLFWDASRRLGLKGSLARSLPCNMALYLSNVIKKDDIKKGLDDLFKHHKFLDIARKNPIAHSTWYNNSGYYYFYGMSYAAMLITQVDVDEQKKYWPKLQEVIVNSQEKNDGSWFDFIDYDYHKSYGTGFAVYTLCKSIQNK